MRRQEPAPFVNAARDLYNAHDAEGAEKLLSPLLKSMRNDAPALHLMGLIKKARGNLEEAERYFRAAIANALGEGNYYNDLAVMLMARGAHEEATRMFRAALALMPDAPLVRINLARCLMSADKLDEAEAQARTVIAVTPGPEGWSLLAQIQRAQERHEDAAVSAAAALERAPTLRGLQHNYAAALDRAGRPAEALAQYEKIAKHGADNADFALNYARCLFMNGRTEDGEGVLESALANWPEAGALHAALARMRLLRGEGDAATWLMEAQIEHRPNDVALRLACADVLHRGHFHERALAVLEPGLHLAPDAPALFTAYGFVLDELDRSEEALMALRRAAELARHSHTARRNLLSTLTRAGRADEALAMLRALREEEPNEQYLIAAEATALRVLGDRRYRVLYDYERYVRAYEIKPPQGHFTAEGFNAALAEVLRQQHRTTAHPLDQHVHNGTQTGRGLLRLNDPAIKGFLAGVDGAVRDYISRLDTGGADPVGRRRSERYRFSGLWSTRLTHGGAMANHVHDRGWISSAYYAAWAPVERPGARQAGWLRLGEPQRPPRNCTAEHMIEPRVGMLMLFPSYIWHGVAPFEGAERLSLSFDVIPA